MKAWRDGALSFASSEKLNRLAISLFILGNLIAMVAGSIPADFYIVKILRAKALMTFLDTKISPYASHMGVTQRWMMFAPNPGRHNTYIDAEITYRNGRKKIWTFPQMQDLGYTERYAKERYRKFANERLWSKSNAALWPNAARYIARLNADPLNPPATVKLAHYWSLIPSPSETGEEPEPGRWQRDVFYTFTVSPGDLR
jgi:hypothetical protein